MVLECFVLVVDLCQLVWMAVEKLVEQVDETEVEEREAVNTARWRCSKACDEVVL
jgi:hypothetical protein